MTDNEITGDYARDPVTNIVYARVIHQDKDGKPLDSHTRWRGVTKVFHWVWTGCDRHDCGYDCNDILSRLVPAGAA